MPIPIEAVNNFVEEEGEEVRHLVGIHCFCHGANGQPDPNCKEHESGGWLYSDETTIVGLVTDISQRRELMETGAFEPGDCVFSPLTTNTISEGDKIIFTWSLPYGKGDVIVRGATNTDKLYYEAVSGIFCIDENKIKYSQDIDYRLQGKNIVWDWSGKTGLKPSEGTRYSIKYRAFIEWIVFVPPVERITHGEDLGSKVMLRKKHLLESR